MTRWGTLLLCDWITVNLFPVGDSIMIVDDGEILKSNYKIILSMKSVVFLNRLLTVSLYLRTQLSKIFFIDS